MVQDKVILLIDDIKKTQHLTDENVGACMGLKGRAFMKRRQKGNFSVWHLERLIRKYNVPNEVILDLFGRGETPRETEKRILAELRLMRRVLEKETA